MKFTYKKESNIKEGQRLYGIVVCSIRTYNGVQELTVDHVDYGNDIVVFSVNQPCCYVCCSFEEMEDYVFETEAEAIEAAKTVKYMDGFGLWDYDEDEF